MIRGDQKTVPDAVSGCPSWCQVFENLDRWTDILLVAVAATLTAAAIAASASVLVTPPNSP